MRDLRNAAAPGWRVRRPREPNGPANSVFLALLCAGIARPRRRRLCWRAGSTSWCVRLAAPARQQSQQSQQRVRRPWDAASPPAAASQAASNVGLTARLAFTLLSAGGVCVVGLVLQRQGTQTQLVMAVLHPRLLSLLTTEQSADKDKQLQAAQAKKAPPPSFKAISSFRLEELEKEVEQASSPKAGTPKAAQGGEPGTPAARRWSFEFAPGGPGCGDSPCAPPSCPGSPAKPRSAPSQQPGRSRLQRIVSGQRLAELAAEREAERASESPGGSSGGVPGVSPFAACQPALKHPVAKPAEGVAAPAEQAKSPGWSAWMEQQSASWSAWASGTLDALLRPLAPVGATAASALQRTHSAPAGQAARGEAPAPVQAPCCPQSSSHEGAICADPLR